MYGFDPAHGTRTEPGKQYAFKKVIYTDNVRGAADFSVSPSSRQAYKSLTDKFPAMDESSSPLNLFIERGSATNRSVNNENELAKALAEIGFTIIRPETLSVTEQIRLFSKARFVMGALGAGMANLAWCKPGTIICELVPQQHPNPCNLALATQMELPYWGEPIETGIEAASHVTAAEKGFDIPTLIQRAKELLALAGPLH
ncbi:capsular polysaccharide biosynthesis protein [Neokomagataea thailandica NBRC 106555]|nr:capsular polysaccharide biosynthesis protein [Neokomagataea thailandica NBRC 106555]